MFVVVMGVISDLSPLGFEDLVHTLAAIADEELIFVTDELVGDTLDLLTIEDEFQAATAVVLVHGSGIGGQRNITERKADILEEMSPSHAFVMHVGDDVFVVVHVDALFWKQRLIIRLTAFDVFHVLISAEVEAFTIDEDGEVGVIVGGQISWHKGES